MAIDDTDQDDPSSWPVRQDGEQLQDELPGQPIAHTYLLTCSLICGIIGAGLGAAKVANHGLNGGLVGLGLLSSLLAVVLVMALEGNKVQLGAVGRGVLWAGGIFGVIGALIPWPIICPNCTG